MDRRLRQKKVWLLFGVLICLCLSSATGQVDLSAPQDFYAIDTPNDDGTSACLLWAPAPYDSAEGVSYIVYSATSEDGPFQEINMIAADTQYKKDYPEYFGFNIENEDYHCLPVEYYVDQDGWEPIPTFYRLSVTDGENIVDAPEVVTTTPIDNWFAWNKINNLTLLIVLFCAIGYFIHHAHRNPNLFIRRIPGLEAVDEAVGRATEMGRPLLYLTGVYEISQLSTIASVNILQHVAETVAQYDSRLINPHRRPITMTVCQEVVREAYAKAGRPDAYKEEDVYFVTEDAFGFVAAADGIMVREKPAANFFLGTFASESLLLAETGAMTGAIQIAGTDSTYQLPFFIVACDYTLIGEELYAASAYLSREPKLLGSLRGQDLGKLILMVVIAFGTVAATVNAIFPGFEWMMWLNNFFTKI